MSSKPWIWLTSANDIHNPQRNLPSVGEEIHRLAELLGGSELCEIHQHYFVEIEAFLSIHYQKGDRFRIFHFAGHGNERGLELAKHNGKNNMAFAKGLAHILSNDAQKQLRLVFLNACATEAQIKIFHQAGIPIVIATTKPVVDEVAKAFAIGFYTALKNDQTIAASFVQAEAFLQSKFESPDHYYRDSMNLNRMTEKQKTHPYLIKYAEDDENLGNERLRNWNKETLNEIDLSGKEVSEKTYLRCDREDQKEVFKDVLDEVIYGNRHEPHMLAIYGCHDEGLKDLAECLHLFPLMDELGKQGKRNLKKMKVSWPRKNQFHKKDQKHVWRRLLQNIKDEVKDGSPFNGQYHGRDVVNWLRRTREAIWITHTIWAEDWHPNMEAFIQQYMRQFWNLELSQDDPYVFIVFLIQYPKKKGLQAIWKQRDPVEAALKRLQRMENFTILPRCEGVNKRMVIDWQQRFYPVPQYNNLAELIFQQARSRLLPMNDILRKLAAVCQEYSMDYATVQSQSSNIPR